MEHKWSELRLWNGGECPVRPHDLVLVLFEDMENRSGFAYNYFWSHTGGPWDIIAYRVEVKPKPLIEMWANVFTDRDGDEFVAGALFRTKSAALGAARGPMDARQILLREVRE